MKLNRATQVRIAKMLAAALAGGSVLGTCQTRFKESVVNGAREYLLYTLLDPTTIALQLLGMDETDDTSEAP
jgi:hypothetical protein